MKTLKFLPFILGSMLLFTQCDKVDFQQDGFKNNLKSSEVCTATSVTEPLYAGAGRNDVNKGTLVGSVTVDVYWPGDSLVVTYSVDPGWVLTEAHIWVGNEINKKTFPKNAAPGRFPYTPEIANGSSANLTVYDISALGLREGEPIYIAAHGVVCNPDGVSEVIPIDVMYNYFFTGGNSYGKIELLDGGFISPGWYNVWCIDTHHDIFKKDNPFSGTAYSSYDLPSAVVDYINSTDDPDKFTPDSLPLVNWIINQGFVGKESSCEGNPLFTYADVQVAIWKLLGVHVGWFPEAGLYADCRVNEILAAAREHMDFVPECGQKMGIVLYSEGVQTLLMEFPVPCGGGGCETAWAYGGDTFIDKGIAHKWGWIFELCNGNVLP